MKNIKIEKTLNLPYTIKIVKEDNIFYTEVEEIPGCWSEGNSVEEAYSNIKSAMKLWIENAIERNIEIPLPKSEEREYSGKFILRMPKELHKNLTERAEKEDISLNQFIVYLLSSNFTAYNINEDHNLRNTKHNMILCEKNSPKYNTEIKKNQSK
jgi:predicted RNase H-like HicB family nuclease